MKPLEICIIGGGAAGFFAALAAAETRRDSAISILEKGPQFLSKVRISGGGRCNVTHTPGDVRAFASSYPRGERALIGALQRFQAADTIAWFETRGVPLKTQTDGRVFPVSDSSQTIIDCLLTETQRAGVQTFTRAGVEQITRREAGPFELTLSNGFTRTCDRLLLATGGCRTPAGGGLAVSLGHTLEPPVPSLFTFHVQEAWVPALAGISVESVEASVPELSLRERGPLLLTHWGLSGPVILRLSACGARAMHGVNYECPLLLNWLPDLNREQLATRLQALSAQLPAKRIVNTAFPPLPCRLWEQLVRTAGISPETRWSALSRSARHLLTEHLVRTSLTVRGKSMNKDEFVTCGGIPLREVNFKTMESRICPGLHFAGELLDIDGITGGFNFQAAWTTGWIAGRAMAAE